MLYNHFSICKSISFGTTLHLLGVLALANSKSIHSNTAPNTHTHTNSIITRIHNRDIIITFILRFSYVNLTTPIKFKQHARTHAHSRETERLAKWISVNGVYISSARYGTVVRNKKNTLAFKVYRLVCAVSCRPKDSCLAYKEYICVFKWHIECGCVSIRVWKVNKYGDECICWPYVVPSSRKYGIHNGL